MRVSARYAVLLAAFSVGVSSASADEIKLKDGKKLYGVIVGYEDNMFRVKTDFGFVLVEKDKIAAIVPSAGKEAGPAAASAKSAKTPEASARASEAAGAPGHDKGSGMSRTAVKPLPAARNSEKVSPPAISSGEAPANPVATVTQPPAPPKEPEPSPNQEEVQGNVYTNFTHGFRMYKAPSWELIEDARKALPNAIVAMGTANESTLMVVGQEKAKSSLEASAAAVEKRLREIYGNYRLISQRQTVVGGAPAIEYKYRGTADEHDWSGTLAVVARGKDVLTMLGMTYGDSDLIQIQENVIARAITSTTFDVPKYSAEK